MPVDLVLEVPARTTALRSCQNSLVESCTRSRLSRETILRLQIVVEELFSNTIKYGYGGECDQPIRLRLSCSPRIELVYEDAAPPFDPTTWQETPPAREGVGRKGIVLALGLAERVDYERLGEGNRLTLRFA